MLTLRYARQSRSVLCPPSSSAAVFSSTSVDLPSPISSTLPYSLPVAQSQQSDLTYFFKEWFMSRKNPLYYRIFEALRTHDGSSSDAALSHVNLRLTESLVLEVLNYKKEDILSCLKFFDWAGRQPGFFHTTMTFRAIFRILSRAKMTSSMLDFLQDYVKQSNDISRVAYSNVLVMGYSMVGQCDTALRVFGQMRFRGLDLNPIAYNVLLNNLIEEGRVDFAESLAREASIRGLANHFLHSVMIKCFCRQNQFEKAEEYLRVLVKDDRPNVNGLVVSPLVTALCKNHQFRRALLLIREFERMGLKRMQHAYSEWMGELVKSGNTDLGLEFLKDRKVIDDCVPDLYPFNVLICRLLRENRLEDLFDLLVEMYKRGVVPNDTTMNAVLCFLCKAGILDSAMELFGSRVEFDLSVNRMAYNYLITTLLGEAGAQESYNVLKKSLEQGNFPGERTLSIVAKALCREGKLDKMKELIVFILDQNLVLNGDVYASFVSAFCKVNRVEEVYLLQHLLTSVNKVSQKVAYYNMIHGFCRARRGDIAASLLMEMQDSGYVPSSGLFVEVIRCLCNMDDQGNLFFGLLELQLARNLPPPSVTFVNFIHAAGLAGKPELAAKVYEMMKRIGHVPSVTAAILLLRSYLKNRKVREAFDMFFDVSKTRKSKKLLNVMIVGLCRINELEYASMILENAHKSKKGPSLECYEELIKAYCDLGLYHNAIYVLDDMTKHRPHISSFIGNVFLLHSLKNWGLYDAWDSLNAKQSLKPSTWMMGHLIGIFSGRIKRDSLDEDIKKVIGKCFRIDLYTYKMMIKRLGLEGIDSACKLVHELCVKGFKPDRWIYSEIIHGLVVAGRDEDARMWLNQMHHKGLGRLPRKQLA